jgi:hypothetical protein
MAGPGVGFAVAQVRFASAGSAVRAASVVTHDVPYGTSETFNIMPILGYHIEDVLVNGVSVGPVYSYTFEDVTAPHSISAVFAQNTYTITPTSTGAGSISPNTPGTVAYGGSQSFTITAAAHNHIADVLVNGESVGAQSSWQFTNVTADQTITASFAPSPPEATSITRPSVSPSSPTHGKTATFTAWLTPGAATATASSKLDFYRSETKTVRKNGKNVKTKYWRLKTTKTMTSASSGRLTLKYKVPSSGKWKVVAKFTGSATDAPSTSSAKQFTVK